MKYMKKRKVKRVDDKMKKIFCVGHATYDITMPVESFPKENTKIKTYSKIECGGGSSANSSVLLSRWGEKTYFIGSAGDDIYGERIRASFINDNVSTRYFRLKKGVYTSTSFILANTKNGKRTITTFKDKNLNYKNKTILTKPDVMLFDGEHYETSLFLVKKYKSALKIIDAGSYKEDTIKLCKYMDYIVCSKDFAESYSEMKIDVKDIDSIINVYKKLEEDFKGTIVITLEAYGSFAKIDNEYKIIPSIKVKAVDSTGAGDIYHGAFTYFISNGFPLSKTMYLSNVAGALSVSKLGSRYSIPLKRDVLSYDK